jgi:hypothetical protein
VQSYLSTIAPHAGKRGGLHIRIKVLEKELARKNEALAETAALLALRKKARAIWGDEDA